jgi:hypothetical protein
MQAQLNEVYQCSSTLFSILEKKNPRQISSLHTLSSGDTVRYVDMSVMRPLGPEKMWFQASDSIKPHYRAHGGIQVMLATLNHTALFRKAVFGPNKPSVVSDLQRLGGKICDLTRPLSLLCKHRHCMASNRLPLPHIYRKLS